MAILYNTVCEPPFGKLKYIYFKKFKLIFFNGFKPGPHMFKVKNMNFPALGQSYTRMKKGQMPEFVLY